MDLKNYHPASRKYDEETDVAYGVGEHGTCECGCEVWLDSDYNPCPLCRRVYDDEGNLTQRIAYYRTRR